MLIGCCFAGTRTIISSMTDHKHHAMDHKLVDHKSSTETATSASTTLIPPLFAVSSSSLSISSASASGSMSTLESVHAPVSTTTPILPLGVRASLRLVLCTPWPIDMMNVIIDTIKRWMGESIAIRSSSLGVNLRCTQSSRESSGWWTHSILSGGPLMGSQVDPVHLEEQTIPHLNDWRQLDDGATLMNPLPLSSSSSATPSNATQSKRVGRRPTYPPPDYDQDGLVHPQRFHRWKLNPGLAKQLVRQAGIDTSYSSSKVCASGTVISIQVHPESKSFAEVQSVWDRSSLDWTNLGQTLVHSLSQSYRKLKPQLWMSSTLDRYIIRSILKPATSQPITNSTIYEYYGLVIDPTGSSHPPLPQANPPLASPPLASPPLASPPPPLSSSATVADRKHASNSRTATDDTRTHDTTDSDDEDSSDPVPTGNLFATPAVPNPPNHRLPPNPSRRLSRRLRLNLPSRILPSPLEDQEHPPLWMDRLTLARVPRVPRYPRNEHTSSRPTRWCPSRLDTHPRSYLLPPSPHRRPHHPQHCRWIGFSKSCPRLQRLSRGACWNMYPRFVRNRLYHHTTPPHHRRSPFHRLHHRLGLHRTRISRT